MVQYEYERLKNMNKEPKFNIINNSESNRILLNNNSYTLEENYRSAFDLEEVSELMIEILLNYDYIVGDRGAGKLRMKGFYDDDRKNILPDVQIGHVQDYLLEYCNFDCPYFILKKQD